MTQVSNQFKMTTDQGRLDLIAGINNVIAGRVSVNQSTALIAGQAVKIEDATGPIPAFTALASAGDRTFGFVVFNLKDSSYKTGAGVEVAQYGSVMQMTASGAIAKGASVEIVFASNKIAAATGANPVIGIALDKAAADNDIIRVQILTPFNDVSLELKVATVTATLAEINAGKTLISGVSGRKILVTNLIERVTGAFTTTTSVDVQSSNASPVKVAVAAVAGLTNGAILSTAPSANLTLGAGFGVALGAGDGLVVANVGTAAAGGTSIAYTISYTLV